MDNIKILVLIVIILLVILFITMLSDSCNIESLNNVNDLKQEQTQEEGRIQFDLEKFIKQNSNGDNKFVLNKGKLEFNILKDPKSIIINSSNNNKYLIYNTNKNNMLFIGTVDDINSNKVFIITVFKNIYLLLDASGNIDPNFTLNSYIINSINSNQFTFNAPIDGSGNDGKLKINTVDSSGNNVNIIKPNEDSGPDNISGQNAILNIDDNGLNIFDSITLNKKQLISYDELQKTLRPCYIKDYRQSSKDIMGLVVFLLQKYKA